MVSTVTCVIDHGVTVPRRRPLAEACEEQRGVLGIAEGVPRVSLGPAAVGQGRAGRLSWTTLDPQGEGSAAAGYPLFLPCAAM
jgi:hypothetical protein